MLNKTRIEWIVNQDGSQGYTANPIKGKCLHGCPYCYAEKMRLRFKQPAEVSWHPEVLQAIKYEIPIFLKKECYILYPELLEMFGELKALPYLEDKT